MRGESDPTVIAPYSHTHGFKVELINLGTLLAGEGEKKVDSSFGKVLSNCNHEGGRVGRREEPHCCCWRRPRFSIGTKFRH